MSSAIKKIVITGAGDKLRALKRVPLRPGFRAVFFPTIEIRPRKFRLPAGKYDWVIFTSGNAVRTFAGKAGKGFFKDLKVAAIGGETAALLRARNIRTDFVPRGPGAEGFLKEFLRKSGVKGKRFLLPRSSLASGTIPEGLCRAGASVDAVTVYDNRPPRITREKARAFTAGGPYSFILFSSPSSFVNFMRVEGLSSLCGQARTAAIGPVTAAAMRAGGVSPDLVARKPSLEKLLESIMEHKEGLR